MPNEKELRRAMNHARRTGDGELYQDLEEQLRQLEAEQRMGKTQVVTNYYDLETRTLAQGLTAPQPIVFHPVTTIRHRASQPAPQNIRPRRAQ